VTGMLETSILTVVTGTLGGCVAGGAMALWSNKAQKPRQDRECQPEFLIDDGLSERIDVAASTWANAQGQPEAAPLIVKKLRLAARLREDRQSRRWHP
jgi:hypothetical protein